MAAEWINRFPISRQPINRDRESRQPINRWPRAAKEADESFSTIPLAKYTAKYTAKESFRTVQAKDFYTLSQGIDDALSQLLVYGPEKLRRLARDEPRWAARPSRLVASLPPCAPPAALSQCDRPSGGGGTRLPQLLGS